MRFNSKATNRFLVFLCWAWICCFGIHGTGQARGLYFNPHWTTYLRLHGEDSQGRLWFNSSADRQIANGFVFYDGQQWQLFRIFDPPYDLPPYPPGDLLYGHEDVEVAYNDIFPQFNRPLFKVWINQPDGKAFSALYHLGEDRLLPAFKLFELPTVTDRNESPTGSRIFGLNPIPEPGKPLTLIRSDNAKHRYYRWRQGRWNEADKEFALTPIPGVAELKPNECTLQAIDPVGRKWFDCVSVGKKLLVMVDEAGHQQVFADYRYDGLKSNHEAWAIYEHQENHWTPPKKGLGRIFHTGDLWQAELLTPQDNTAWYKQGQIVYCGTKSGNVLKLDLANKSQVEVAQSDEEYTIKALTIDHDGTLWYASGFEIYAQSPSGQRQKWSYAPDYSFVPTINAIYVDSRNTKWFSFEGVENTHEYDGLTSVLESAYLETPLKYDGRKWHYVSLGEPTDTPLLPQKYLD